MSAGVFIFINTRRVHVKPKIISAAQSTPKAINDVLTDVFSRFHCLEPKSCDTTTEHPMLHPNANAV